MEALSQKPQSVTKAVEGVTELKITALLGVKIKYIYKIILSSFQPTEYCL